MERNQPTDAQALSWLQSPAPVPYPEAMAAMDARVNAILDGAASELIWLLEHPALYVGGTSAQEADLLEPSRLPVFHAGRGGQYTYHGPGQRVVYAMMDLARRDRDLRAHVRRLEEWAIRTLAIFGVKGERRAGRVGVWVETQGTEKKIAALGVRCRRWVTSHGLALNIAPDLAAYAGIVPCGIKGYGVTSLADLGVSATMEDVDEALRKTFPAVFE